MAYRTNDYAARKRQGRNAAAACAAVFAAGGRTLCALALSALAFSCSGRLETTIRGDLSARMALRLDVPELLSARVRQIGDIDPRTPLFDASRLKEEFQTRKSISLVDLSAPNPDSLTSIIWVPDLVAFSADKSLVPEGMIGFKTIPGEGSKPALRELSVSLTKENASAAFALFPGIDQRLLDTLNPPALEKDSITAEEYRMNLETVIIGKKAMPAFDACAIDLTISVPKTILASSGGSAQGQIFRIKIPLFALLTLEKPIVFSLRWAE